MDKRVTLGVVLCVAAVVVALATHAVTQEEASGPGRFSTQVVTDGPTFWVYTIDTTTGRVWFLDRQRDGAWEWVDDNAAPNGSGPVGRYQLTAFANDKGAHLYVCDTTTGDLWSIDEENRDWLPRGRPLATIPE